MSVSLLSAAGIAVLVYASTNIDDLLILAVFFADPRARIGAVIAGRFIGLAVLVLVSAGAALLAMAMAMAVPGEWIALLGLVPLVLGLRLLPGLWGKGNDASTGPDDAPVPPRRGFFCAGVHGGRSHPRQWR